MADDILQGVLLSRKETKTLKQLKDMGNIKVPVQKKDINYYLVALEEFLQEEAVTLNYQLKGEWAVGEAYVVNDFCKFEGDLYICKSAYSSDPESDNPSIDTYHWDLFFSGSRIPKRLLTPGATENISWAPTVDPEEFTVLGNITSDMTSLVINLSAPPDSFYCYEYSFRFTTPAVSGITTFSILDHNGTAVNWLGHTPALVGGKTYEVSVVDGLAVIGESV